MSIEKAKAYLRQFGAEDRVIEFPVSSATVELAAEAAHCEPARIAKTLSFRTNDGVILIVAAGDTKIDNPKYKARFGCKARMLAFEEVEPEIGHAVGGLYGTPHGLAMAIFLPYVMRAYGDAACKKLAELSDVCRLTTPQESDSVKADAFIGWIEELKVKMQIPQYPEMIRKADVKQIAKWAEKEANPLYPTPEVWNRREFERFLLNVCVQGSSEKDRQCCQDK